MRPAGGREVKLPAGMAGGAPITTPGITDRYLALPAQQDPDRRHPRVNEGEDGVPRRDFPHRLVGGGEKGYQNGGEVVPCQGSRSE